jgi:hypothetical protein
VIDIPYNLAKSKIRGKIQGRHVSRPTHAVWALERANRAPRVFLKVISVGDVGMDEDKVTLSFRKYRQKLIEKKYGRVFPTRIWRWIVVRLYELLRRPGSQINVRIDPLDEGLSEDPVDGVLDGHPGLVG